MSEHLSARDSSSMTQTILLTVILGCFNTPLLQAQSVETLLSQSKEQEYRPEEVRILLSSSLGIGLVTGNIEANPQRFVRPGLAFTGMIKVFLLYKDPSRRFGPGVLAGICTTIGNRVVHEESVWPPEGRRPLDGKYLHQYALYIGPIIQLGRKGGDVRYQIGLTWNRSNWRTNLYAHEDWGSENWAFKDDQVGAGAFILLTDNIFSFALMYHEFEGRLIPPPEWQRNYSIPIIAKTTWMTIGISF